MSQGFFESASAASLKLHFCPFDKFLARRNNAQYRNSSKSAKQDDVFYKLFEKAMKIRFEMGFLADVMFN